MYYDQRKHLVTKILTRQSENKTLIDFIVNGTFYEETLNILEEKIN